MKKIMFGLAAAIAMVAAADIESSNIVGYTTGASGAQNNFVTIPFAQVGYNTSDIQQIKIGDNGAGTIGWGGETFDVWAGAPTVVDGSSFIYYDASMDPGGVATDYYWGDDVGNKASFSVAAGQGVVLGLTEGLTVTYAGEIAVSNVNFTAIQGNNFAGNNFAMPIDIQAIKVSDDGAGMIGWGGETFDIWEGAPTVKEGSSYIYYDASMDPDGVATDYYWGDDEGNMVKYAIPAGQGFVLGLNEGLSVTIVSPLK